jgi:hypothetical protein
MKEYNLKRHYDTKHVSKLDTIQLLQSDTVADLKEKLKCQQLTFKKQRVESELGAKVSYIVSEKIGSVSKLFTDGEYIKECMESAAEMLCPSLKRLFMKVSLSGVTVARRIEELAEDIENTLKYCASKFV